MASEKPRVSNKKERHSNGVLKTKKKSPKNPNRVPLGSNRAKTKEEEEESVGGNEREATSVVVSAADLSASQQLRFFLDRFQSANFIKLSSLELESIKDTCIVEQSQDLDQDSRVLSESMKNAFGKSWKEVLCEGQLLEGEIDPGNPAVLAISTSALISLELLRGLRPLTIECPLQCSLRNT